MRPDLVRRSLLQGLVLMTLLCLLGASEIPADTPAEATQLAADLDDQPGVTAAPTTRP